MIGEAIPLWRRAGELALRRIALPEAIDHLQKGLRLNLSLPPSQARDRAELEIRSLLGTSWMALRGWPAQEVEDALTPASELARALGDASALVPISFGLWANVLVRGRIAESLNAAREATEQARSLGNGDLEIVAHCENMVSHYWLGNFILAKEHGERIRSLYREDAHRHIVIQTNFDPLSAYGLYGGPWTWILGYPDQAVRVTLENEEHARGINHPYDLGFSLTTGAHVFDYRCEPDQLLLRVEEAERVGRESSVPFISEVMAQVMRGVALLRAGRAAEAVVQLDLGVGRWHGHGGNIWNPYTRALQAEAMGLAGDLDGALRLVDACIEQTGRPGWEEQAHLAEALRLKAWMLRQRSENESVEPILRQAIEVARSQQAKSWELRTSTTLAEVLGERGERSAARDLLQPVYDWFTEGFDTHDLKRARTLLDQLR
jgi:predicted ATPase